MQIAVISFTGRGEELSLRIKEHMEKNASCGVTLYTKYAASGNKREDVCFVDESLSEWTKRQFSDKDALIFIGACGIAVRAIAPFLKGKLEDIPVLVAEESGSYIIPILSGHYGGGNALASDLAGKLGATAVITTATDVNGLFAVDVFAKKNRLRIGEKDGIAMVSGKLLETGHLTMRIDGVKGAEVKGKLPKEVELLTAGEKIPDVLVSEKKGKQALLQLYPQNIILGMGCRRGKTCEEIEAFVCEQLAGLEMSIQSVRALATIEQKREEPGFLAFAEKYKLSFLTYPKEVLEKERGDFSSSSFVKSQVGVDNVCERAAVHAARQQAEETQAELVLKKTAQNGMTLAVVLEKWSVNFDEA